MFRLIMMACGLVAGVARGEPLQPPSHKTQSLPVQTSTEQTSTEQTSTEQTSTEQTAPVPDVLERVTVVEVHMGVPVQITLYARSVEEGERVAALAFRRIAELDAMLSDYKPESELSKLNSQSGKKQSVPVSSELFEVVQRAVEVSKRSEGAFDVTVGPVVQLWRKARKERVLPSDEERQNAVALVGWKQVQLRKCPREIQLMAAGMRLDLGGIAKGYIVDEALTVLRREGVDSALVNAGGDIVMGDAPPGRKGWTIAVEPLVKGGEAQVSYLQLSHAAVATSGDAYQFVELEGKRYSHIVNPATGLGLTTRSSVTVIASDGATADAYASALSVLGGERGIALIEMIDGASALIVQIDDKAEPAAASHNPTETVSGSDREKRAIRSFESTRFVQHRLAQ